jgi:hypothetical protein
MWPTRFATLLGLPGYDRDAWGGPTFAGVWAVHAAGGLVVLLAMPWILRGLTQLHARLLGRKASADIRHGPDRWRQIPGVNAQRA